MLRRLEIAGYGLIDRAAIEFGQGATIFTGETGSGKTMILGALSFALGARASAGGKASVTLWLEPNQALRDRLNADGFQLDADEDATFARDTNEAGKSSVRINGRPSTAGYLREIGAGVAEIVGQHEAQRLLTPAYHLELLDRFGGAPIARAREAVRAAHAALASADRELQTLRGDARKANERYDDARYALEEIDAAAPGTGEDVQLSERRRFLDNVERIAAALRGAHEALAGDDGSASNDLGAARAALGGIADINDDLRKMADQAAALQDEAAELATQITRELDATDFDAGELETINARLDVLDKLKRKYGATLDAVLEHAGAAREIVAAFESRDERVLELEAQRNRAQGELDSHAAKLTALRQEAATRLSAGVVGEYQDLALANGAFDVAFESLGRAGSDGAETAEFRFSANAGEAPRPLNKAASGGELSRVLLALIVVLAAAREPAALVFDEIDSGVGGATATAVGIRIGRLAKAEQVVCVTHLAQIATWADRHYVLEKHETKAATTIAVREVSGEEPRAAEIARMLSGESHEVALEHARTLLRTVAR
jgi:DNA repair protein RecN (Recombination protein N)